MKIATHLFFAWDVVEGELNWRTCRRVNPDWSPAQDEELVLQHPPLRIVFGDVPSDAPHYFPLESSSGLFLEVARLDATPEAIKAFAEKYGTLTRGHLFFPVDVSRHWQTPPEHVRLSCDYDLFDRRLTRDSLNHALKLVGQGAVRGDSLAEWQSFIHDLKALVAIWEAMRDNYLETLETRVKVVHTERKLSVTLVDENKRSVFGPHKFVDVKPNLPKLTLAEAADWALTIALSRYVNHCSSVSLHAPDSPLRHKLAIVPRTLRDAIWLQFALAVIEHRKYGSCEVCGKPFEISPQVARTNRKLCSAACKAKAHRKRREQALALASQGRTPKQIAKQVGSQLSTVQKWLTEAQGEK